MRSRSGIRIEPKRGLDGLTAEELRASRRGWWDDLFTHFVLQWIPPDTRHVLDIGCGLATAAHALLPSLTGVSYLGIDPDEERLHQASALLAGAPYSARVQLQQGRAERRGQVVPVFVTIAERRSTKTLHLTLDRKGVLGNPSPSAAPPEPCGQEH